MRAVSSAETAVDLADAILSLSLFEREALATVTAERARARGAASIVWGALSNYLALVADSETNRVVLAATGEEERSEAQVLLAMARAARPVMAAIDLLATRVRFAFADALAAPAPADPYRDVWIALCRHAAGVRW